MYNRNEINKEAAASFLQETVEKIKSQENPDVLTEFKKIFKKNVPLTLRSYVAAYLVKEACRHYRGNYRNNRRDFRSERKPFERLSRERRPVSIQESAAPHEERVPRPRVQIDPSVAVTIFISIGRNRRVYPKDLIGLLVSVAGLERDRIGDIRVLANYSFIQLFAEDSEKVISALNGYDYRGRKLAVSYSRQRDGNIEVPEGFESSVQDAEDAAAYEAATKAANNEPFSSPKIYSNEESSSEFKNDSEESLI